VKKIRLTSVILSLLLMTPPIISADDTLYHWKSEDGQSHFSDKKPEQHTPSLKQLPLKSNKLNTMVSTPSPPANMKSTKPSLPSNSNSNAKKKKKKKKAAEKAKRSKLCKKHKEQLRALRGRMRNGYSAKQAPKLLQRERTLNDLRRQYCH